MRGAALLVMMTLCVAPTKPMTPNEHIAALWACVEELRGQSSKTNTPADHGYIPNGRGGWTVPPGKSIRGGTILVFPDPPARPTEGQR